MGELQPDVGPRDRIITVLILLGSLAMIVFFSYLLFVGDDMPAWAAIPLVILMLLGAGLRVYVAWLRDES